MTRVSPIEPLTTPRTGGFLAVRSSAADGACGVHGYPCQHPGVDVLGKQGTLVQAPEGGTVKVVTNGASPPYEGYGPWVVVFLGDSGKYHLLGHLEPSANRVTVGQRVEAKQVVGATSSANHTHWEVRNKMVPPAGVTNQENNDDPVSWLRGFSILTVGLVAFAGWGAYRLWRDHR